MVALKDRKREEGRFRAAVESAPTAMVMVDSSGAITLANSQAEELFGYSHGELPGKPVEELVPGRSRGPHAKLRDGYFKNPRPRLIGTVRDLTGVRSDGRQMPLEIGLSAVETSEGRFVLAVVVDISERKALQAKDRFLANMSHELRTPLNAIIGFTGTLLMKLPGPLTADQEQQLRIIQESSRHLLSLVNDLLDLSKVESGDIALKLELLDCGRIMAEVHATLRTLAEARGLALGFTPPAEALRVRADERALRQILINLVSNAIKFTDRGSVTLALSRRDESDGRRMVEIRVTDTGIGIRPEHRDRLFHAFVQMDSTNREGSGLGLHLSQKLAQLMDGRIEFESEYGSGSTFRLLLPLA